MPRTLLANLPNNADGAKPGPDLLRGYPWCVKTDANVDRTGMNYYLPFLTYKVKGEAARVYMFKTYHLRKAFINQFGGRFL